MTLGKNFSNLKVILVEPNGPLNVGSVARLCSNFEVDELRIVSPKCDIFSLEAKKMSLKGHEFLENYFYRNWSFFYLFCNIFRKPS